MRTSAITSTARLLHFGASGCKARSFSTSFGVRAAAAAAPSSDGAASAPSSSSAPSSASASSPGPVALKRPYARKTAVPASSSPRIGVAKNASTSTSTTSPSISASASRARAPRVASKPPTVSASALAAAAAEADAEAQSADMEDAQPVDHTLQAFSGIDDYAHLAPPPSAGGSRTTTPAPRAPRRAVAPRSPSQGEQPTPSPPMTSLPSGTSTLPMVGGYPGMPIPATLLSTEHAGGIASRAHSPDISGEVAAPAGSDWSTSFYGLSQQPFSKEVAEALLKPLEPEDVELKPDGLLYLPEIKYRRTLNAAFGPGGWGLAPRGETNVGPKIVSREWGLVCLGRLVSVARGEQEYFDPSGIPTATEACKSNALMRCCKDLGIASELWDPRFIREYKAKYCEEVFTEHVAKKTKRKQWRKKGGKFEYPWKEV